MVFTGKPSAACEPCRIKRRKCDQKRPECSSCVRMGVPCKGYRDTPTLRIKNETSQVMEKARHFHGSSKYTKRGVRESKVKAGHDMVDRGCIVPVPADQRDGGDIDFYRIPLPLEATAIAYFFSVFSPPGAFSYLPAYASELAKDEKILQTLCAPALGSIAVQHGSVNLMRSARCYYSASLAQTNIDLSDPQTAILDSTLLRVLLLSAFEALAFEGRGSPENWTLHVQGALRLVLMRDKSQLQTDLGRRLFHHAGVNFFVDCIMRDIQVPPELLQFVESATDGDSELDLANLYIMRLACQLGKMDASVQNMTATVLIEEALRIDNQAVEMLGYLNRSTPFQVVDATGARNTESETIRTFGGIFHIYQNHKAARLYNTARLIRLRLRQWMFSAFKQSLLEGAAEGEEPLRNTGGQTLFKVLTESEHVVNDMLASIPYALDMLPSASSIAARYLIWPLASVGAFDVCSQSARAFIIDRLRALAEKFQLKQALQAAIMLEERASIENWVHVMHLC